MSILYLNRRLVVNFPLKLFSRSFMTPMFCNSVHVHNSYLGCLVARDFSAKPQGASISAPSKPKATEHINWKTELTYEELVEQISNKKIQLFDVRNVNDFQSTGSIPGAINIPLPELKTALSLDSKDFKEKYGIEKPKYIADNLVFYGFSDVSAASACEIAHNAGYKKSKYYPKGWSEWSSRQKKK